MIFSNGTKDPRASDTMCIQAAAATGNTIPKLTLNALTDHGFIDERLPINARYCCGLLSNCIKVGVYVNSLSAKSRNKVAKSSPIPGTN